jgi:anti-sigma regulatory factor (Ser/Thr protein kinase)
MEKDTSLRAMGWAQSFPVSQGVRAGRQWTREHLESLKWTRDAPEVVDAILLSVSELVTNAHVHAHSDAQLVLTWDSHCLHVSVHDSDPVPPAKRPQDLTRTGGRGMAIVDALADGWSTHAQASGKTVTACFVPPGAPKPLHGENVA